MRRRIMAGNWKMYKTVQQTTEFFQHFNPLVNGIDKCNVVVFPPFVNIPAAQCATHGTEIKVGGQDVHWGKEGAYTSEVSAGMLAAAGCEWVLVGHSERRLYGFETDADVLKKTQSSLEAGLIPVVCVGEKQEERKAGKTEQILIEQFAGGLAGLTEEQFSKVVLAYEPVWAIGTGQTATPEVAAEAHRLIRSEVDKRFGSEAAEAVRILYGGSVKPDNVERLMQEEDLDGALVGGASLDAESFSKIVHAA
jgi:triosephosphate isomerase